MVPHFDVPLRYTGGNAVVNDQGSLGDIAARVYGVCVTEPGTLDFTPEFGLPDQTFTQQPLNGSQIGQIIERWVPDSQDLVQASPSQFDEAVVNAGIKVCVRT